MNRVKGLNFNFKLIIGILIGVFALSTFFCVVAVFKTEKPAPQIEVKAYEFNSTSGISAAEVSNYSTFEITNKEGFIGFCRTSAGCEGTKNKSVGWQTFENKTILLNADITLEESDVEEITIEIHGGGLSSRTISVYKFAGTFDGQNHYIDYSGIDIEVRGIDIASAFCYENSKEIKNLIVKNADLHVYSGSGVTRAGTIAKKNSGTIENCIVKDPYIWSNRYGENCEYGSIAGENTGTVSNCLVYGTYYMKSDDNDDEGAYGHYFVTSGNEASNCVFMAGFEIQEGDIRKPADNDTNAFADWTGNYNGDSSALAGNLSDYWFKYPNEEYKYWCPEGWSYFVWLKSYINLQTFTFIADEPGSVTVSELEVPDYYADADVDGDTIEIFGQTIVATTEDSRYEFKEWTTTNDRDYTAKFERTTVSITFVSLNSGNVTETGIGTYDIAYNSTISIVEDKYANSKWKEIKFTFTKKDGRTQNVTYRAANTYYINGHNLSNATITDDVSVSISGVTQKTYGVTFN